jgi:glycosyltransferase involved in cell wall biosynthesis
MPEKLKLLILYAEVMPYNVVCFKDFVETTGGEIVVISWGEDKKLTPYKPPALAGVRHFTINDYNLGKIKSLIGSFQPDALYISGRMEKVYLEVALYARKQGIPVIGNADDQFFGSWKQLINRIFSNWLWKRYFDFMMVPGLYQYEYMRYLGFKREQIIFPQYCADTALFNNYYEKAAEAKIEKDYILFTGRLNTIKGLDMLLEAFKELKAEKKIDLKLLIVGNGPLMSVIPKSEDILVKGFLEQKEIIAFLPQVKFFCLPSRIEPWGLVIHEFAAAGLPIICSSECGAATAFVKEGYNGYLFRSRNKDVLKQSILRMANLSNEEIKLFGKRSFELSKQIVPSMWTAAIKSIII